MLNRTVHCSCVLLFTHSETCDPNPPPTLTDTPTTEGMDTGTLHMEWVAIRMYMYVQCMIKFNTAMILVGVSLAEPTVTCT